MTHLLHIDTSSAPANSASREVAATFRQVWEQEHPHSAVTYRDLVADPVPHLAPAGIAARFVDAGEWSDEQRRAAAVQDSLISELADADAYLFSVPMYNWGIPSVFKAWLDQIIVSGRTTAFGGAAERRGSAGNPDRQLRWLIRARDAASRLGLRCPLPEDGPVGSARNGCAHDQGRADHGSP